MNEELEEQLQIILEEQKICPECFESRIEIGLGCCQYHLDKQIKLMER